LLLAAKGDKEEIIKRLLKMKDVIANINYQNDVIPTTIPNF